MQLISSQHKEVDSKLSKKMSLKQEETIRPLANFHPNIWGDQFLVYDEVCMLL